MRVASMWTILVVCSLAACSEPAEQTAEQTAEQAAAPDTAAASSSATGARPCAVLTEADVTKALGKPAGKPARDEQSICQYIVSGERIADMAQATLTIEQVGLAVLRPGITAQGGTMEEVPGLGDGAFFSPQYGLYVEHRGRSGIYLIGDNSIPDEQEKQMAIDLAKATVSRL
ncbi:MAG: DUF3558 family protein [Sphingomonas bacterium]|nr:DUF3558 family protein [Sphingomonas bacterium]